MLTNDASAISVVSSHAVVVTSVSCETGEFAVLWCWISAVSTSGSAVVVSYSGYYVSAICIPGVLDSYPPVVTLIAGVSAVVGILSTGSR